MLEDEKAGAPRFRTELKAREILRELAGQGRAGRDRLAATAKRLAPPLPALVWRLTVYFALLIAAFQLLSMGYVWIREALGLQFAQAPGVRPAEAVGLGQARLLIATVVAWAVTARVGRDRLAPILPMGREAARHLLQGTLWGLAGIGATLGAIAAFGGYQVSGLAISAPALAYYLPLWLVVAAVNGLAENLAFMGYPLVRIARTAGWTPAILLVALLFAVAHMGNPGESPIGIASVFLIGVLMAAAVRLTGDLWLSAGLHAGVILGEDLVFSVPDSGVTYTGHLLASRLAGPPWLSGGGAGPEGSVLATPAFAALLAVLWLVYRHRPLDRRQKVQANAGRARRPPTRP